MNLNVKIIKTRADAVIPQYATEGSAACDLTACIGKSVTLMPHCTEKIPTGIAIAPAQNDVVGLVYSRSGMGARHGITLANSVGVIDSDYRGEIVVALVNHSDEPYILNHGDRIAQLMFVPIFTAQFEETDMLQDTERGTGGFGSTGK